MRRRGRKTRAELREHTRGTAAATAMAVLAIGAGCGLEFDPAADLDGGSSAGGSSQGPSTSSALGGAGGEAGAEAGAGGATTDGPKVTVRFRSNTDPFDHQDGLAAQTPTVHRSGVRKLQLFLDEHDPDPITIFDFGQDYVEIDYDHGADTAVYVLPASVLPEGLYTVARVVHSHTRYQVASVLHVSGLHLLGEYDCLQVLSDDTLLDGTLRDHGYFEYVFSSGSWQFPVTGDDAPVPAWSETGGFSAGFEGGEWAYTFAVNLPLTPHVPSDVAIVLEVNMHQSFRWQDQDEPGYQPEVFDTHPFGMEPVMRFGANAYWIYLE